MKTALIKMGTKFNMKKNNLFGKVKRFVMDETSARGSSEEGYLTYAGIVLGILALGIAVTFMTGGFETIGNFFQDGVTGNDTNPNGWGK
ncbi:hypothetical protein G3M81_22935 [Bacillus paralicheniformis]|jgi:hypothetical protein|uniref:hypothetical protein n=1 Tax=Bacillus TaxID=1386 RepID=UPI0013EE6CCA|nr:MULTISPECIES: hypothetical protein [Bacillus]QII26947.1 hypothetical protein G3M80_20845 [Bacillus altitudinis]QII51415.1 hypothetical protein G3M81_22935 [Bacillus paralicheniformis]